MTDMSAGNGGRGAEARMETMCPIDPSVRPGDCNAIHSALTELRLTLKEHGRALRKLSREQAGLLLVLQTAGEQLARIEAKFGMRPKAGKRR